ncbi:RCC1-like G exchanging factor-like protein isoform X1 [Stegostoma tigrinum]|uniref:RCC1-like G exchanging factor-like protein isoform X1 n=1 Tax=Stegostoma tigrinum TaxID=3053191 RepID=UPI00286FB4A2|nr:RCC1-like G exchanging factor-like protein isoform X1 [Stegostoma tigrinum]
MSLRSCGWRWLQARGLRGAQAPDPVLRYMGKGRRKSRVFVWGFAHTGALGLPHLVLGRSGGQKPRQIQLRPCGVELEQRISSAACGYGFTLLASQTRDITKVWGMGLNKDSQIGFHRSRADRTKGYEFVLEPSPVPLPLERPQETRVIQVSCGRAHSLLLTDNEGVFSMGNNAYGQCGRSIVDNEIYSGSQIIHRIEDLDDKIVEVTCGQDHSLFRTEKGEIYSCGWGADGQTGLGHYGVTCKLTRLTGDIAGVNIVQTATYGDFCLAVSKDGNLFGWGNSEYLQFSAVTEATQVSVPKHLPFKGVGKIKQAACGGTHAAILNREGNVFVWGYGILGKGCNLSESGMPEMIPSTLFGCSEFTPEVQVDHIRCGLNHFAAITNRGELFVWGKNLRGCLGIGSMDDQYFPWRVTVPGNVVDVACGVDHMVALTKSFI